jgi:hypothetical protein
MPYALEHWGDKAIVVNSQTGRHYSLTPMSLQTAKAQMRLLESKENTQGLMGDESRITKLLMMLQKPEVRDSADKYKNVIMKLEEYEKKLGSAKYEKLADKANRKIQGIKEEIMSPAEKAKVARLMRQSSHD